ncbi:unnamed protein product [Cochlearia groenlandica]
MANFSAMLTIALLLCSMLMCTARPDTAFSVSNTIDKKMEKIEEKLDDVAEENCGDNDEDCLMRRSLVAHVDYIYTQKHKKNL